VFPYYEITYLQGRQGRKIFFVLKEDIRSKVLVDPRGDGEPWEDIKRLINYVVTIDATYTQVVKGRDNVKSHSDTTVAKGAGNTGLVRDKESRRSKGRSSTFYKKNKQSKGKDSAIKSTDKKDGRCFLCHREGHMARDCPDNKKVQSNRLLRRAKNLFLSWDFAITFVDSFTDIPL
jgi:hypothetical protein